MVYEIASADPTPEWARPMTSLLSSIAKIEETSSTTVKDAPIAWAIAARREDGSIVVGAVAKDHPAGIVLISSDASPAESMAMARSLARRSGKKIDAGGLVSTHVADLDELPLERCPPQFLVGPATSFGLALEGAHLAVACTWAEMALAPEEREAAVKTRAPNGHSRSELAASAPALSGLMRSLRKANEPLRSHAAWAVQSLLKTSRALVGRHLQEVVSKKGLTEDRAELIGALADEHNALVLEEAPAGDRVVLCVFRLPKSAGGRAAVGYFLHQEEAARSKLAARHPEEPMTRADADAGFQILGHLFDRHRALVEKAIGQTGAWSLHRGFHADASLDQVVASFAEDGFVPLSFVLDE